MKPPKPGDRVCLRNGPQGPFAPPDEPLTGSEVLGTVVSVTGRLHVGGGRSVRVRWDGGSAEGRQHGIGLVRVVESAT